MMVFPLRRIAPVLCLLFLLSACDRSSETPLTVTGLEVDQPCDLQRGCVAGNASMVVRVEFGAQARALQPFPVQVRLEGQRVPESVTIAFSMPGMDMGLNRYQLSREATGVWSGLVTLPICVSGRSDWLADVELVFDDERFRLRLPFQLEK